MIAALLACTFAAGAAGCGGNASEPPRDLFCLRLTGSFETLLDQATGRASVDHDAVEAIRELLPVIYSEDFVATAPRRSMAEARAVRMGALDASDGRMADEAYHDAEQAFSVLADRATTACDLRSATTTR